jgi:hypothetical protein
MPTAGQLRQLAQAAAQNATDLAADARILLDAGRSSRAYALATLTLEELGKMELCHKVLAGRLDDKGFRHERLNHPSKPGRSRVLAILSAPAVDRVFATVEDDSAMTFSWPLCRREPRRSERCAGDTVRYGAHVGQEDGRDCGGGSRSRPTVSFPWASTGRRPGPALRARGIPCGRGTGRSPAVGRGSVRHPETTDSDLRSRPDRIRAG